MKFRGRKLILAIMAAVLLFGLSSAVVTTQAETLPSGNPAMEKPTKSQIAQMYKSLPQFTEEYEQRPSAVAPYSAGKLSKATLQGTLCYLNYVRYVANLPALEMDDNLNDLAQHGAVLLLANGSLTHRPTKPADMPDAFYERGYAATTSSNIGSGGSLVWTIRACMDDSNDGNADQVGHRRWFLNPKLKYVGFGYADNGDRLYTVYRVFDSSGAYFDYDYVSWPVSGNMPTNLFEADVPWSVSLNPAVYRVPNRDDITITVTGGADGKTWTFNKNTAESNSGNAAYMRVSSMGYGVRNCIIFRPEFQYSDTYEGIYQVKITGLTRVDGTAATLEYSVDFFDVNSVPSDGWLQKNDKWYYYQNGEALIGWHRIGGVWYFFNETGAALTGQQKIDGNWYFFGSNCAMKTGWQLVNGTWCFYGGNGTAQQGWLLYGGKWYYLRANGAMVTKDWVQDGGKWYYMDANGYMVTGTVTIDGKRHQFNASGVWQGEFQGGKTGWVQQSGKWYYYQNGTKKTGWLSVGGQWYFLNGNGQMLTGWQYIGGKCYYFHSNGAMFKGWLDFGYGTRYYMKNDGSLAIGWLKIGSDWYFFNHSGAMKTGWHQEGSKWYYLRSNGVMATGTVKIGGKVYNFDNSGVCLNP